MAPKNPFRVIGVPSKPSGKTIKPTYVSGKSFGSDTLEKEAEACQRESAIAKTTDFVIATDIEKESEE